LKKGKDNVDKLEDQLKQVQDTNSKEIEEKNNRVKELEAALSEKLRELKKGKNDVDKLEDQLKQVQDTNSKEIEEKNSRVKELEAALSEKSQECNGLKERSAMLSRVQEKNDVKTRAKQLEPEKVSDTEKLHAEIREAHAKQTTENERYDELTRFAIALRILLHESLYVVKHFAGTIKEEIKLPRNNHARPNVASMMYRFEFLLFVCRKSLNTSRLPEVLRGEDTFRCSGKESADEWQELANPELVRKSDEIIQEWVIKGVGHNLTGMDESAKPWLKGVSIHNNILSLTCRETSI
jgi:myosin heavy subunit